LGAAAGAQFGLSAALETTRPRWRDPDYGHRLRRLRARLRAHPDRPLLLVLGSSRVQNGISPADMPTGDHAGAPLVFNFGLVGYGPVQVGAAFERMLADGVRPAFVLVELFPASLGWGGTLEEQLRVIGPRMTAGDLRRAGAHGVPTGGMARDWAAARAAPWHAHRFDLMNHWLPSWLPTGKRTDFTWASTDPSGWLSWTDAVTDEDRAKWLERARASYAVTLGYGQVSPVQTQAVRDILALCRRERMAAAAFQLPEGPVYRSWYSPQMAAKVAEFSDAVRRECGVPVFDPPTDYPEADFLDSHHLLPTPARRYSRWLWAERLHGWLRGDGKS
jgi:hypothetical protein